ncbi:MAG: sialidase family protein [Candidatus Promineifilaceae bacterium]
MRYIRLILLFVSILLYASIIFAASAQDETKWTIPEKLSETVLNEAGLPASTMSPVLVADLWGNVHAIFAAKTGIGEGASFDTLYYSKFDGYNWTQPIDVLYKSGSNFWSPQLTVDSDGWLHLVWIDGPMAMYSQASAHAADLADSWSEPIRVSQGTVRNASIVAGLDGYVHMVYCSSEELGYLAHARTANGSDWSRPVEIAMVGGCWTRAAEDENGGLHVVYSEQPGAGVGSAVYYTRSADGGASWSIPLLVDSKDEGYLENYGPSWVNLATVGTDEIHIIWDGTPAGQRWHQWSADRGETWSKPSQISSIHRGLTEPNALAVDSSGRVHMVSLGWLGAKDKPIGPFYTSWRDGLWSPLAFIGERGDWEPEGGSAAILGGNHLVAGWRHETGEGNEVWVSDMAIDSPSIPPAIMPTPSPSVNLLEASVLPEIDSVSPTIVSTAASFPEDQPPTSRSSSDSILAVSALVFFLLGIIVLIRLKRHSRRF